MNTFFTTGTLLISMLGRHHAEQYVAVTKAAGARGGTIMYGRSVTDSRLMQALSLADVPQEIVFTLMGAESAAVLAAVQAAAHANPKKLAGTALLLNVSGMPGRSPHTTPPSEDTAMDSGRTLITVIVNNGYADDVMAAARKAGAFGGTILNARGTGTEEDVKFFSLSIVPEKEMLLIVAYNDKVDQIVAAISATPHLCEPGGGIVYTMPVGQFIVLGQ